jgi:hypothetical protein
MAAWGLRTDGVQTNSAHATGEVQIELKGGEPRYDICMLRALLRVFVTTTSSTPSGFRMMP